MWFSSFWLKWDVQSLFFISFTLFKKVLLFVAKYNIKLPAVFCSSSCSHIAGFLILIAQIYEARIMKKGL